MLSKIFIGSDVTQTKIIDSFFERAKDPEKQRSPRDISTE